MATREGLTRRSFLRRAGAAAAGLTLGRAAATAAPPAATTALDPSKLAPWVDPLPIPQMLRNTEMRPSPDDSKLELPYYKVAMREVRQKVHRDLPPTRMWGFNTSSPGPVFETRSGHGLLVEWSNELPAKHFLPVDHTLYGAEPDKPEVRAVAHLHGGRTPPHSDGFPGDWTISGQSVLYHYPNQQDAALLLYRDDAMGISRLNNYAGLQGLFLVRDDLEDSLNLPRGKYEVPLLLCDRTLRTDGQLDYPVSPDPKAPWVPSVLGNVVLANGKLWPFLSVEPRIYRFRIANGSNERVLQLTMGEMLEMQHIGSDQGLLAAPVSANKIGLAPSERADLLFDFSPYAGERVVLKSVGFDIVQFRVASTGTEDTSSVPQNLRPIERTPEGRAVKTRRLTLDGSAGKGPTGTFLLNKTPWQTPVTERPVLGTTEIWELVNLTGDFQPIHLHLVRFQLLDRRPFDAAAYRDKGELHFAGAATGPDPGEAGWKDTVRCEPGTVTRIIVPFEGYAGDYAWGCAALERADNQMMRPFEVVPAGK
jgi:spore coat protein A